MDTSPTPETVSTSVLIIGAGGAGLRTSIELAKHDIDCDDERGTEWTLDGRVVLCFTDWDPSDEGRRQRVRLRYQGRHFHCPDRSAFRWLARKIRP